MVSFSKDSGVLEFIDNAKTVQQIQIESNRDLSQYLCKLGDVEMTYMDSCSGMAIATYLLAVGDRHLENLMVQADGRLFHVDFGFILGKHPPKKGLLVPQIRLNQPMILGMGGVDSQNYRDFKQKTSDAFLILRKHRQYLVNLVMLMADAGLKDL